MSEIRKLVAFAISDPGHAGEGYKGDRSLTEWQTDAVMRVVSELEKANVGYVDANTALIARIAALSEEKERLRAALSEITEHVAIACFDIWTFREKRKSHELSQMLSVARDLLREAKP